MTNTTVPKPLPRSDLDDLHAQYRRRLLSYFGRRVGTRTEAEDLVQEVFLRFARREPGDPVENKAGFLFTAAANLIRDRARQRQSRGVAVTLPEEGGAQPHAFIEDCTPDRVLVGKEKLAEVLACLDELPPRTRDIFLLFRVECMRQREIAKAMDISVSAVEKHIMRGVAHLAERFGRTSSGRDADGR